MTCQSLHECTLVVHEYYMTLKLVSFSMNVKFVTSFAHSRCSLSAGKDCTNIFFGLHRQEVLQKPAYRRLKIGTIKGQNEQITPRTPGGLHTVPYSEPSWLTPGFKSPYFKESHYAFLKEIRKFMDEVVVPDSETRDSTGRTPDPAIFEKMAALNIPIMRLGPGPHLKGLTLMNGAVKPEEVSRRCHSHMTDKSLSSFVVPTVRLFSRDDSHFRYALLRPPASQVPYPASGLLELCNPATRGYNDGSW